MIKSNSENRINTSNFLNNECVNIYMSWYRLYYFLLGGKDTYIIDLDRTVICTNIIFIIIINIKFYNPIILNKIRF